MGTIWLKIGPLKYWTCALSFLSCFCLLRQQLRVNLWKIRTLNNITMFLARGHTNPKKDEVSCPPHKWRCFPLSSLCSPPFGFHHKQSALCLQTRQGRLPAACPKPDIEN